MNKQTSSITTKPTILRLINTRFSIRFSFNNSSDVIYVLNDSVLYQQYNKKPVDITNFIENKSEEEKFMYSLNWEYDIQYHACEILFTVGKDILERKIKIDLEFNPFITIEY